MDTALLRNAIIACHVFVLLASARAQDARPYGIEQRVPWTTSRIRGTPDPPAPYRTEQAFPHLTFQEPLAVTTGPVSDRLAPRPRTTRV